MMWNQHEMNETSVTLMWNQSEIDISSKCNQSKVKPKWDRSEISEECQQCIASTFRNYDCCFWTVTIEKMFELQECLFTEVAHHSSGVHFRYHCRVAIKTLWVCVFNFSNEIAIGFKPQISKLRWGVVTVPRRISSIWRKSCLWLHWVCLSLSYIVRNIKIMSLLQKPLVPYLLWNCSTVCIPALLTSFWIIHK